MGNAWVNWFQHPKPKAKPSPPKNPVGRVGNYAAEVDTVGMDEEMKKTMGFGKQKKKP